MKFGPVKPLHVIAVVVIAGIILAVWLPGQPSPDNLGKHNVSEANSLLNALKREVEIFYANNRRIPDVDEIDIKQRSGKFVEKITGSNPYYATLKKSDVYPPVAGKTLGWSFDPKTGEWDECSLGTVDLRFKSLRCRNEL